SASPNRKNEPARSSNSAQPSQRAFLCFVSRPDPSAANSQGSQPLSISNDSARRIWARNASRSASRRASPASSSRSPNNPPPGRNRAEASSSSPNRRSAWPSYSTKKASTQTSAVPSPLLPSPAPFASCRSP